jgi:hypothetical protein
VAQYVGITLHGEGTRVNGPQRIVLLAYPFLLSVSGKGCGVFDRKNPDVSPNCDEAVAV